MNRVSQQGVTKDLRTSPWIETDQNPRILENKKNGPFPTSSNPSNKPLLYLTSKKPYSRQFKTSFKIRIPKFWAWFWRFWQMVWVIFDIGWVSRGEYKDMLSLTTVISIRCKISFPSIEFEILPLDQAEQLLKAINHDFKWTKSHDHSHVSHVDDHMIITWHHQQCTNFEKHFQYAGKWNFYEFFKWIFYFNWQMHPFKVF